MPGQYNPLAYDRYQYVFNNPLSNTDPSGHIACEQLGTESCDENGAYTNKDILPARDNSSFVYSVAEYYAKRIDDVNVTSLDAMVAIIEIAAGVYGDDWSGMLDSLSNAFLGVATHGPGTLELAVVATKIDGCAGVGRNARDCPEEKYRFGDSGFHEDYRDNDNQIYHVWGYIADTANPYNSLGGGFSLFESLFANVFHEYVQSELNIDEGWGTSWQDYVLSEQGMYIGSLITVGTSLGILKTSDLGNIVRCLLGPNCGGSQGRLNWLEAEMGPLLGSPPPP